MASMPFDNLPSPAANTALARTDSVVKLFEFSHITLLKDGVYVCATWLLLKVDIKTFRSFIRFARPCHIQWLRPTSIGQMA